jgi:hypothetical protein
VIKIHGMNKEDIRKSYKTYREENGKNNNHCLKFLFEAKKTGLIHYLVGMENLTTVEKQYISSLIDEK